MLTQSRFNSVPHWQRSLLYLTVSGLAVTGLAWMALHYASGGFAGEDRPYALLHQLMVLHGILGYATAVAVGMFLGQHVATGWRSGRNLATGLSVAVLFGALMGTALVLYYSGEDALRTLASLSHQMLGLGLIAAVPLHVARHRARRALPRAAAMQRGRHDPDSAKV
jgi:hypothetical protein